MFTLTGLEDECLWDRHSTHSKGFGHLYSCRAANTAACLVRQSPSLLTYNKNSHTNPRVNLLKFKLCHDASWPRITNALPFHTGVKSVTFFMGYMIWHVTPSPSSTTRLLPLLSTYLPLTYNYLFPGCFLNCSISSLRPCVSFCPLVGQFIEERLTQNRYW